MRVALFITCFNDTLFPQTGQAVVEVLERLGCDVDFPQAQTCCGQMHLNGGYPKEALELARRFVAAFEGAEAIVCPSTSCVATVRRAYPDLAKEDPDLLAKVEAIGARTWEFSGFLLEKLGVEDVGASYPHKVAYHPTCSSLRGLAVGEGPRRLLSHVKGLDLVEVENAGECCGFGGAFSVKNSPVSSAMLADKTAAIRASGARVCTALDNSCLMHIGGGLSRQGAHVRAVHLAEILAARVAE